MSSKTTKKSIKRIRSDKIFWRWWLVTKRMSFQLWDLWVLDIFSVKQSLELGKHDKIFLFLNQSPAPYDGILQLLGWSIERLARRLSEHGSRLWHDGLRGLKTKKAYSKENVVPLWLTLNTTLVQLMSYWSPFCVGTGSQGTVSATFNNDLPDVRPRGKLCYELLILCTDRYLLLWVKKPLQFRWMNGTLLWTVYTHLEAANLTLGPFLLGMLIS